MDDRPEMKYINRYVKEKVCASGPEMWLQLGTELLTEKDTEALYMIKSNVTECSIRCLEMFKLWLERQTEASWRCLIMAMKQTHMDKLAFDIERLLLIEQTHEEDATGCGMFGCENYTTSKNVVTIYSKLIII